MTGYQLLQKVQQVDIVNMSGAIIDKKSADVIALNKAQLHKGIGRDGLQLSPKYSEDSYFKTAEAAANYAAWKKRLFPEMTFDVPNFIITGLYHSSISIKIASESVIFESSASFAPNIAAKTKNNTLGLTTESKATVWMDIVKHPLLQEVKQITGFR